MWFEVVQGPVEVSVARTDRFILLLEGDDAPLARPLNEPLAWKHVRGIVMEGELPWAVRPDELCLQIARETFFLRVVSATHQRSAASYLGQRLLTCEPWIEGDFAARVMAWMTTRLDQETSLSDIADRFTSSKSGVSAAFKRARMRPPMKELARLRVERACRLLKENELSVAKIALAVGYDDPAVFNRFFRRHTGRSPREYRDHCLWIS